MLLWFWYCKWRILADNSFTTGYKHYEINSVNKVYRSHGVALGTIPRRQLERINLSCSTWLYNVDRSHFVVLIMPCALFLFAKNGFQGNSPTCA